MTYLHGHGLQKTYEYTCGVCGEKGTSRNMTWRTLEGGRVWVHRKCVKKLSDNMTNTDMEEK